MHLCIYVYSLHTYIMKENGKAAIQRHLARLEEWATRALWNSARTNARSWIWEGRNLGRNTSQGCLARMYLVKEHCGPTATPRPGSWSWGRPSTGSALSHGKQSHGAGNRVYWQTLTEQVMNRVQGTAGDSSRQQKSRGRAEPWPLGLTEPEGANHILEKKSGWGPKGSWAGQLNSWCIQGFEMSVFTGPGGAGEPLAICVPQQQGPPTASLALWVKAQPGAKVILLWSVLVAQYLYTAHSLGPWIQGRYCKTGRSSANTANLARAGTFTLWVRLRILGLCIVDPWKDTASGCPTAAPQYLLGGYQEVQSCMVED